MITEVDEIEDFAAEAMAKPAEEYVRYEQDMDAQRNGEVVVNVKPAAPTLVRCVACRGTGVEPTFYSAIWGGNCWICSGWGRNLPHEPFRGPFRRNPIRSLMQSLEDA